MTDRYGRIADKPNDLLPKAYRWEIYTRLNEFIRAGFTISIFTMHN